MTATALAAEGRSLSRQEVQAELAGVICRCTGYRNVVTAVQRYLDEIAAGGARDAERVDG
jgi:carbon-monoxide dehydrogenase small subunit